MKRRQSWLCTVATTVAIVVASTTANAVTPKVDVSSHAITCSTVTGTAKLSPALDDVGLSPLTIKLKGNLAGCVDTTDGAVLIDSATFSGVITDPTNFCPDLITTFQPPATASGTIIYKWKANRTTPTLQTQSTQVIDTRTGDLFSPGGPFGPATYVQLAFGTVSVSGAFTGGDGGITSSTVFLTSQDWAGIQSLCATATGVKTFDLGLGAVTLQ